MSRQTTKTRSAHKTKNSRSLIPPPAPI